jgi:hypothetical protein
MLTVTARQVLHHRLRDERVWYQDIFAIISFGSDCAQPNPLYVHPFVVDDYKIARADRIFCFQNAAGQKILYDIFYSKPCPERLFRMHYQYHPLCPGAENI